MFPVTWQCLRCCVETRDLRYVIIFRSKKINTDGVILECVDGSKIAGQQTEIKDSPVHWQVLTVTYSP